MRNQPICRLLPAILLLSGATELVSAATIRVPRDRPSIQAAIDAALPGDMVLVSVGTYKERLRLKPGITVKSDGGDAPGKLGLARAEATIIDGDFTRAEGPGVSMAEDATIDGFTVTGVGQYDDELWRKHHATQGDEQPHEHIGAPGTAGISVIGVERCTVTNNIVHHIGYTGIAILGVDGKRVAPRIVRNVTYRNMGGGIGSMKRSTAIIERNICFENYFAGIGHDNASPLVIDNICYGNVRAGIGISEGSSPIVRGNKCYKNRRAGIGVRDGEETRPIIENNECYENDMAGIGNRNQAQPIIRHNRCYGNRMAGIGSEDGSRAVIEFNECFENALAGIGSRLGAAPVVRNNRCYRNTMAGIAASDGARPVIVNNECFENKMAGIGVEADAMPVVVDNRTHHNGMAGIGAAGGARPVIVANEVRENKLAGIGIDGATTMAVVVANRCLENRLVAIGLPDGATAVIHGNELQRTEAGAPPLVALRGGSVGLVSHNSIRGGGVAGVLVEGNVQVIGNRFQGRGAGQGSAVWVWKGSNALVLNNRVAGYRNVLNANGAQITALDNMARDFAGPSIIVKSPSATARVAGNVAFSTNPQDKAVDVADGTLMDGNARKEPGELDETQWASPNAWLVRPRKSDRDSSHAPAKQGPDGR